MKRRKKKTKYVKQIVSSNELIMLIMLMNNMNSQLKFKIIIIISFKLCFMNWPEIVTMSGTGDRIVLAPYILMRKF